MYFLGLNGGLRLGYQDTAAVLLKDGKVIAAVEEERLNRIKHAYGMLPERSIQFVLDHAGITMKDVDVVASHGSTWGKQFPEILRSYLKDRFEHCPELLMVHHHDAHAASAYYASGFDEAIVLTTDGSGDGVSTQVMIGSGDKLELKERISRPNSLGIFYSILTQFCGFRRDSDEYKLMGLSSYGDRRAISLDWLLYVHDGYYDLNTSYLKKVEPGAPQPTRQEIAFSENLCDELGPFRRSHEPVSPHYENVAAAAQQRLEDALVAMVIRLVRDTGISRLCLAGGVALNCVANQRLMDLGVIDSIYVQPASSDAGISYGAAMLAAHSKGIRPEPMHSIYLGPEFDDSEIRNTLELSRLSFEQIKDPAKAAAEAIAAGEVVGWFQGRMEFGPRALGNRSILANPTIQGMQDKVNAVIKFREEFRPFCPSVLEEDTYLYFSGKQAIAPYMTITYDVREEMRDVIPSVTHVDGTARIQTVNEQQNPLYYRLLKELKQVNGHGVVMNTSFNVRGEPIVNTPREALATFVSSGMDRLIIGSYMLKKSR